MVVLPVSVRDCTHCCALFLWLTDLMTGLFWNKLGISKPPPMGHCQSRYPDGSFEERNLASLWELSLVEDFLLLNLRVYDLSLSEQGKHVLVSSQASAWISATKIGCKINASFDNVCILWFLKGFRVCASWVGSLLRKICLIGAVQYILWKIVDL